MEADELTALRAAVLDLLPDTCDLLTLTRTGDGYGGFTEAWGTASAAVACRMDHFEGREVLAGGAVQTFQGHRLTLPYNATITTAYRIQYGGNQYNVLSVSEGSDIAVKRAMVEKARI